MKIYVTRDDDGDIDQMFSNRAAAEAHAGADEVEERTVYDGEVPTWLYWHRGANVYPDGTFDEWDQEHVGTGEVSMSPVDDSLNARDEPWDGHTQGHCGEHVSIYGSDRALVEAAFQQRLAAAIVRQNGRCQSKHHNHRGAIDGVTVFESGFMRARSASTGEVVEIACWPYSDHDWGEWSEWRQVDPNNLNRQRVCKRCVQCSIECHYQATPVGHDPA